MTTALIDADILIYAAASSAETVFDWGDGNVTQEADEDEAITLLRTSVKDILNTLGTKKEIMCISAPSHLGWRKEVLPTYKENRATTIPPKLREFLKQYVRDNYNTYEKPKLEGDDILGILMTHPTLIKGVKVCCSIDKDMRTIPGEHYNFGKAVMFSITRAEADHYHMMQTLTGDTTDGYKGCPGVGPDTAEDALRDMLKLVPVHRELTRGKRKGQVVTTWEKADADSLWEVVVSHFHKAGLTEADALVQARVARICRHTDYDFKSKEVILWNPSV